jgi:hypothetical protein
VGHPGAELAQGRQGSRPEQQLLGLAQLVGLFFNPFLEALVPADDLLGLLGDLLAGGLEAHRHLVERRGQAPQLVAGVLRDPSLEVPSRDLP